jgi:hypothetical protein
MMNQNTMFSSTNFNFNNGMIDNNNNNNMIQNNNSLNLNNNLLVPNPGFFPNQIASPNLSTNTSLFNINNNNINQNLFSMFNGTGNSVQNTNNFVSRKGRGGK